MTVKVELEIEITGNVTADEANEFFIHKFEGYYCTSTNPLRSGKADYNIVDTNVNIVEE
jgi:hypothetical protein